MKNYLLFLLLFLCSSAIAQEDTSRVYSGVEVMPEFPGGESAMYKYLSSHTRYPPQAKKKKITGKVYVNFIVEKDGKIAEVKVLRGAHPLLDEESLRVISSMPAWSPGTQDGRPVRVSFNMPLNFTLR
jgi:protein TonB